jgi:hypothetical protein
MVVIDLKHNLLLTLDYDKGVRSLSVANFLVQNGFNEVGTVGSGYMSHDTTSHPFSSVNTDCRCTILLVA